MPIDMLLALQDDRLYEDEEDVDGDDVDLLIDMERSETGPFLSWD